MTMNESLHEVEYVELRMPSLRPVSELLDEFEDLGFTLHDDVVSLDRTDRTPPWQHSSIVEVEVRCDGEEVFGFDEGAWDVVRLKYLFATLPFELADTFIDAVFELSKRLSTPLIYRGNEIDANGLKARFAQVRSEVLASTGEDAGSEGLAILIQSMYRQR
jgi:hypothetical protein